MLNTHTFKRNCKKEGCTGLLVLLRWWGENVKTKYIHSLTVSGNINSKILSAWGQGWGSGGVGGAAGTLKHYRERNAGVLDYNIKQTWVLRSNYDTGEGRERERERDSVLWGGVDAEASRTSLVICKQVTMQARCMSICTNEQGRKQGRVRGEKEERGREWEE